MKFPYGYARPPEGGPQGMGTMLTIEEMRLKKSYRLVHPETQYRFEAMIIDAYEVGVALGCGTGWRAIQPNQAGFAANGNSWHQSCPLNPESATAFAIDTVPNISWDWMQVHCGKYGLRTFRYVNNEPWHIQLVEIPASRRYATTLPSFGHWDLPEGTPAPVPPTPTPVPPPSGGTFILDIAKNNLTDAKRTELHGNGDVYLIQQIAQGHFKQLGTAALDCGKPDGDYGPRTQTAVKELQRIAGLEQDGQCGPKTWTVYLNKEGK